jgi:WD40 repeat protein
LSTAIELLILDPETLTTLGTHGGHYAFTPSEAPFILHADAWAGNDLVASGGEDHCVHVWHRRHGRHLQRLEGHTQAVNAVSWSPAHRMLASASDDHTVILWCPSCRGT